MRLKITVLILFLLVLATGCMPRPGEIVEGYYRYILVQADLEQAWELVAPESREQLEFGDFERYWTDVVDRQEQEGQLMALEIEEAEIDGRRAQVWATAYVWDMETDTETETPVVYELTRVRGGWRIILPETIGIH